LKDVTVAYEERPILNGINWTIKPGEFWQLIGPNGSGKSTLLTMIDGDNPKAFGQEIYLFGQLKGTGETVWDIKKKLGYFTPSMMELFKARRHKAEGMIIGGLHDSIGLYHTPSAAQQDLAGKWLKVIGLECKSKVAFVDLSQVEQRMVLIARAMIKHPPVLILDEPSNGLDDYSAAMLVTLINKIAQESRSTILYVSHRSEDGLQPDHILELIPSPDGSAALVR
jgi:molybdate transport system ATP-binding protein